MWKFAFNHDTNKWEFYHPDRTNPISVNEFMTYVVTLETAFNMHVDDTEALLGAITGRRKKIYLNNKKSLSKNAAGEWEIVAANPADQSDETQKKNNSDFEKNVPVNFPI